MPEFVNSAHCPRLRAVNNKLNEILNFIMRIKSSSFCEVGLGMVMGMDLGLGLETSGWDLVHSRLALSTTSHPTMEKGT